MNFDPAVGIGSHLVFPFELGSGDAISHRRLGFLKPLGYFSHYVVFKQVPSEVGKGHRSSSLWRDSLFHQRVLREECKKGNTV